MKNSKDRYKKLINSMSDSERRKAGQMARQHLAEQKESGYQFRRKIILFFFYLTLFLCLLLILIVSFNIRL